MRALTDFCVSLASARKGAYLLCRSVDTRNHHHFSAPREWVFSTEHVNVRSPSTNSKASITSLSVLGVYQSNTIHPFPPAYDAQLAANSRPFFRRNGRML